MCGGNYKGINGINIKRRMNNTLKMIELDIKINIVFTDINVGYFLGNGLTNKEFKCCL